MLTYQEAIKVIRAQAKDMGTENICTSEIVGRVCANNIYSPIAIQPFDNSAMDGFTMHAEDLAQASKSTPVELECIGKIAAGDKPPAEETPKGCCWEIMTGAAMPADCDTIVPVENITTNGNQISFTEPQPLGKHIRKKGEDFQEEELVVTKGTVLGPEHVLVFATLGINTIEVNKKVKVAVLNTGKEVINDLSQSLQEGQIYNSTGPYLISALNMLGVEVEFCGTLPDNPEEFPETIKNITNNGADIIISTGAVSAGRHDFIKNSLTDMNAEILFHKVFIRPGKPNLFAKLNDGTIFFGLPGNPVATVVGLRFFIEPLIRDLMGLPQEKPLKAKLKSSATTGLNFRFFLKATANQADDGKIETTVLPGQQSFMVKPFTKANAWAIMPEDKTTMEEGEEIDIYPLFSNGWNYQTKIESTN